MRVEQIKIYFHVGSAVSHSLTLHYKLLKGT